jgi:hypothetical protein
MAEHAVKEQPELRFEHWGNELGPEMQGIISGMTNPDPMARVTIDQVLAHPCWQESSYIDWSDVFKLTSFDQRFRPCFQAEECLLTH